MITFTSYQGVGDGIIGVPPSSSKASETLLVGSLAGIFVVAAIFLFLYKKLKK